jgi:hypothetical protein
MSMWSSAFQSQYELGADTLEITAFQLSNVAYVYHET